MLKRLLPVVALVVLIVAACGESTPEGTTLSGKVDTTAVVEVFTQEVVPETTPAVDVVTTTTEAVGNGFPVMIEAANGGVTIEERPERVVSISPTATEVLFAVGAGEQVVAVDSLSDYPEEAPVTELSAFTPSVEAIASYNPDLVLVSYDPGDLIAGLEAVGIPVLVQGTALNIEGAYLQWEQIGAATGHSEEAEALVAETSSRIESAFGEIAEDLGGASYYYELDPTLYSVTSMTFMGGLLSPSGMTNIADKADVDGYGYPQLSAEYVVASNPTFIFLADTKCCGVTKENVAERPGWETLSAVMEGRVIELDDDIASRWGPRIADLVEGVAALIEDL